MRLAAIMAGVVGALVLAIIASAAWNLPSRWFAGARSVPRLSIVVLPFANLGGDPGFDDRSVAARRHAGDLTRYGLHL
jgi:hypothetical protein